LATWFGDDIAFRADSYRGLVRSGVLAIFAGLARCCLLGAARVWWRFGMARCLLLLPGGFALGILRHVHAVATMLAAALYALGASSRWRRRGQR